MTLERVEDKNSIYLMAHPWKALADYVYTRRKKWKTFAQVIEDLRLDERRVDPQQRTL